MIADYIYSMSEVTRNNVIIVSGYEDTYFELASGSFGLP